MEGEEVELPLKEMATASSSVSSNGEEATLSSDNESWTILDEEEEEVTLNARVDVVQALAQFTKRENLVVHQDTDSDIEPIDEKDDRAAAGNMESLNSDGIPVGEELSPHGDQYLWSPDTTAVEHLEEDDDDDDDLEIIEPAANDSLCPTGYPPEELMERFSEIVKGRTYLHHPNQALNLYLTGTLVIVAALVFGLGLGHFKGWSERLELQEQYADIREERMDELTESLVNCMTGEEGLGGDDQDLDDIVIRQLRNENEKLRYELQILKDDNDEDHSANEEMTAILRDRINDLLIVNADLEKEVVRLRYAPFTDPEHLMETKESLNTMAHENDQLKLAIAKERYGKKQVPLAAKEKLNILQTENEELKTEVRKFRYGVHDTVGDDEDYNSTNAEVEFFQEEAADIIEHDNEPNFVTLTKIRSKPVLPPVILLGGKQKDDDVEDFIDDDIDDDEGFVEDEPAEDCFKSFKDIMEENFHHKFGIDMLKVGEVIDVLHKNAQELLPDKEQIEKIKKSAEDLSQTLKEKWDELDLVQEKDKLKGKLTKTIVKALKKAQDAVSEEFEMDAELWSQRLTRVQEKFQTKWQEVMSKFTEKKACDKNNNGNPKESVEDKVDKVRQKAKRAYSPWSMNKKNSTSSWIFERAKNRDVNRKENTKSDWLFDRASSRKRFHHLLSEAEWYNRRFYSKYCEDDDCRTIDQNTYVNHPRQHHRGETQPLRYIRDDDDDDDEDDDDDFESAAAFVRVQRSFAAEQRRRSHRQETKHFHQEAKKSKKAEKRSRYQHQQRSNQNHHRKQQPHLFGEDHVVHFMQNKAH